MPPKKRHDADEGETPLAVLFPNKRKKKDETCNEAQEHIEGTENDEAEDDNEDDEDDEEDNPDDDKSNTDDNDGDSSFHEDDNDDAEDDNDDSEDGNDDADDEEEISKPPKRNARLKTFRIKKEKKPNTVRRVLSKEVASKRGTKTYQILESRSNPRGLVDMMGGLNEQQKESVREIGFGSLLDLKIKALPPYLTHWLVEHFDAEKVALKMENGEIIYIEEQDVHIAFGIPLGAKDIATKDRVENVEFVEEWKEIFRNKAENKGTKYFKITPKDVREEMLVDIDGGPFFKRCFITLFISLLVDSMKNGGVNYSYMSCLEDLENVHNLNWCGLVLDCLVEAKNAWDDKKQSSFSGSLLFLTLFYVDRVQFGRDHKDRKFPIFLGWTQESLKKRQKDEMNTSGFRHGRVREQQKIPPQHNADVPPKLLQQQPQIQKDVQELPYVVRLQRWVQTFTTTMEDLATNIIKLSTMAKETPPEFMSEPTMKSMHDTAKKLMGIAEQEGVQGNETYNELENIWSQSQHPFWNCPELQQCLKQIEKAFTSKKEIKKMDKFPSFELGIDLTLQEEDFDNVADIANQYMHMNESPSLQPVTTKESEKDKVDQPSNTAVGTTKNDAEKAKVKHVSKEKEIGKKDPATAVATTKKDATKEKVKQVTEGRPLIKEKVIGENAQEISLATTKNDTQKEKVKQVTEGRPLIKEKVIGEKAQETSLATTKNDTQKAKGQEKVTYTGPQRTEVTTRVLRTQRNRLATQHVKPPPAPATKGKDKVMQFEESSKFVIRKAKGTLSIETKKRTLEQPVVGNEPDSATDNDALKKAKTLTTRTRTQPKREVIIPNALRSPFYDRAINPGKKLAKEQKDAISYALFEDKDDTPVFLCGEMKLLRSEMRTMEPKSFIDIKVIDAWTMLLNDKEKHKAPESPYRFFATASTCEQTVVNPKSSSAEDRYKLFAKMMEKDLNFPSRTNVTNVDMMLFPILDSERYYVISFNFVANEIYIIDQAPNATLGERYETEYGEIPELLKNLVVRFLTDKRDSNKGKIRNADPIWMPIKWTNPNSHIDSGVYAMRHLETYKAERNWTCDFKESSTKNMTSLRMHYALAILSSTWNELQNYPEDDVE